MGTPNPFSLPDSRAAMLQELRGSCTCRPHANAHHHAYIAAALSQPAIHKTNFLDPTAERSQDIDTRGGQGEQQTSMDSPSF